jgi:hypothetical protein
VAEIPRDIRAMKPAKGENAAFEKAAIPRGTTWAMRDLNSRPLPCERSDPEPERTPADENGIGSNDPDDDEQPGT